MDIEKDIRNKIDLAQSALDRTLGLISGCDNKTSIILALVGVFLTAILTEDGMNGLSVILDKTKSVGAFIYICCLIALMMLIGLGMYYLVLVLCAKTEITKIQREGLIEDSKFFFGSVSANKNLDLYKDKFNKMSDDEILEDLLSQNYINSIIANEKYKNYNLGLKLTVTGIFGFLVLLIVGKFF